MLRELSSSERQLTLHGDEYDENGLEKLKDLSSRKQCCGTDAYVTKCNA